MHRDNHNVYGLDDSKLLKCEFFPDKYLIFIIAVKT